jgi:hypothetical protein
MVGNQVIHQGHKYRYRNKDVIALEPCGNRGWIVGAIHGPWFAERHWAMPHELEEAPMKYFQGQIPNGGA